MYLLSVVVGLPLLVVLWALVLEVAFIVVGSVDRLGTAGMIAAAIVGAARLLAYVYAPSSHELAKAVPLSLAVVLITGGQLNIDAKLETMLAGGSGFGDMSDTMLVVLVGLEWTLRFFTDGSNALLAWARAAWRRSDAGVWGTLRAIIRRPGPRRDRRGFGRNGRWDGPGAQERPNREPRPNRGQSTPTPPRPRRSPCAPPVSCSPSCSPSRASSGSARAWASSRGAS